MDTHRERPGWIVLLFLIGGALGFAAARSSRPEVVPPNSPVEQQGKLTALGGSDGGGAELVSASLAKERARLEKFDGLTAADMPGLFAEYLAERSRGSYRGGFSLAVSEWSLMLSRWAQLDPEGGLAFLLAWDGKVAGRDRSKRESAISILLNQWAVDDPDAALAAALGLEDKAFGIVAARGVLSSVSQDPEKFFAMVESLPGEVDVDYIQGYALGRLAKTDLDAAFKKLAEMPAGTRTYATGQLAANWAATDPAAALEWAMGLGAGDASLGAKLQVLDTWAADDPWTAAGHFVKLREAGQLDSGISGIVTELLRSMARDDIGRAFEWSLHHLSPEDPPRFMGDARTELLHTALQRGEPMTPAMAEHLFADLGGGQLYVGSVPKARIPEIAAMLEARSGSEMPLYSAEIARRWYATDEAAAEAFIGRLNTPELQQQAWINIAHDQEDIGASLRMLDRAPGGPSVKQLAELLRWSDPIEDSLVHLNLLEAGRERTRTFGDIARRWTHSDPSAAVDWAIGIEEPAEQRAALEAIGGAWSEHDYSRSSAWVATLDPGPGRDSAITGMLAQIREPEPDAALEWAQAISATRLREYWLTNVLGDLGRRSPAAARDALEGMDIPADLRQRLGEIILPTEE